MKKIFKSFFVIPLNGLVSTVSLGLSKINYLYPHSTIIVDQPDMEGDEFQDQFKEALKEVCESENPTDYEIHIDDN